jgi:cupin fold WbuC family metalloprotein
MFEGFRRQEGKTVTFWPEEQRWVDISDEVIRNLRDVKQNARICFHMSPEAVFHDMLVAEWRDLYTFPMHRHHSKPETIQIIRGSMELRLMSGQDTTFQRLFRDNGVHIPANIWHQTVPVSDYVIYREIKPGPFLPTDNEFWTGEEHL